MTLPLEGVRVLDLSRLLPGGFCSLMLADFGADVLKVEDTGLGDYVRWAAPYYEGVEDSAKSALFLALNRGKRSLVLLETSADAQVYSLSQDDAGQTVGAEPDRRPAAQEPGPEAALRAPLVHRRHAGTDSRVIVGDSYNYYQPRDRYYERRTYRDWDDGPRAGVGIRTPGVSVGIGVGGDRW